MKIIEGIIEVSGTLGGLIMVSSLSKGVAAIPVILLCLIVGILVSLLFSEGISIKQKLKNSGFSIIISSIISYCFYLLNPAISIWIAFFSAFGINFYNFRYRLAKD